MAAAPAPTIIGIAAKPVAQYLATRYYFLMHIISRKALRDFWERYPQSQTPLLRWYKIIEQTDFVSFSDLRQTFPAADLVDDLVVFNIGGNKYRLIASVHFNRGKLYVRHLLTHQEYDRGEWKK